MTCVGLLLQSGATTALSSERENSLFYLSTFYIDTNTFVNLEKYNVHFEQIQIDDTLQSGRTTKERTLSLSSLSTQNPIGSQTIQSSHFLGKHSLDS